MRHVAAWWRPAIALLSVVPTWSCATSDASPPPVGTQDSPCVVVAQLPTVVGQYPSLERLVVGPAYDARFPGGSRLSSN